MSSFTIRQLSYQRYCSFQKDRFADIINGADYPYKDTAILWFAGYFPIPALSVGCCSENHLSPPVVNAEIFYLFNANGNRTDNIIQSIIIRSKSSRYENIRVGF